MSRETGPVLWFLCGTPAKASSRLQGYLIHEQFRCAGIDSHIVYAPQDDTGNDFAPHLARIPTLNLKGSVSIIQKLYGGNTDWLIDYLKSCGSSIVYVNCDIRPQNQSWTKADLVVTTSSALARYHCNQSSLPVGRIFDPFEYSHDPDAHPVKKPGTLIRVVWFGDKSNWDSLVSWKHILDTEYEGQIELLTVSNHRDATWPWSLEAQKRALQAADIGILPLNADPASHAKSANRLTQLLAMGVPTIAGDLESYREVRDQGIPVSIATNDIEFRRALDSLLDTDYRRMVAKEAYRMTIERFSPEMAARRWMEVLGIDAHECSARCHWRGLVQATAVRAILRTMILADRVRRRLLA